MVNYINDHKNEENKGEGGGGALHYTLKTETAVNVVPHSKNKLQTETQIQT